MAVRMILALRLISSIRIDGLKEGCKKTHGVFEVERKESSNKETETFISKSSHENSIVIAPIIPFRSGRARASTLSTLNPCFLPPTSTISNIITSPTASLFSLLLAY